MIANHTCSYCVASALSVALVTASAPARAGAAVGPPTTSDPSAVAGDPAAQQAKHLRAQAEQAFFDGDHAAAIAAFKQAHAASPHPTDLFNLGRIFEDQGKLAEALEYYKTFAAAPRLSIEQRAAAVRRIEVLRTIVEQPQEATAASSPQSNVPHVEPPTQGNDAHSLVPAYRPLLLIGSALTGIGAAVALSGGVGFGLSARRSGDRVNGLADGQNPDRLTLAEVEDLDARGKNAEAMQIAAIAAGGGLTLIGTGIVVGALIKRNRRSSTAVVPAISRRSVGATAHWKF